MRQLPYTCDCAMTDNSTQARESTTCNMVHVNVVSKTGNAPMQPAQILDNVRKSIGSKAATRHGGRSRGGMKYEPT